jgi:acetylornithine deacetylase/succinyl-diaminopimelate desuccinylase-like protein
MEQMMTTQNKNSSLADLKRVWAGMKEEALEDYYTFLRFESVSTDPQYKSQVRACADWLIDYIKKIGFKTELWETHGNPVIFASHLEAGPDKPTLLIYNHYDVQPVDPLNEWETPPFEPSERNGEVYARGAEDNKGQCFYVLQALKFLMQSGKPIPINIKLVIEGEEESASTNLVEVLQQKNRQKQLKADYLAIVDMGLRNKDTPAVTLGVRGLVTMEVRLQGSSGDLHSGSHGGIVINPLHALVEMLSTLHDSQGRVTIPGFYDDIVPMDPKDLAKIALDFDAKKYEEMFGAKPTGGEKNFTPFERAWNRPTLEINGISGGYGGKGFKTVIPAKTLAKVSCRLVPNQDPHKVGELVAKHLKKIVNPGIKCEVEIYPGMGKAIRANPSSKVVEAFSAAYEELFQKPCECIFDGGSIPIVTMLAEASDSDVILLGFGLPDDQIHAPNEHFGVDRLEKGFLVMVRAIEILGES